MKMPGQHDPMAAVLAGVALAAQRTRRPASPNTRELVELPPLEDTPGGAVPVMNPQGTGETAAEQPAAPDLPPLDQSGLDPATVAQGGDSFDALTKGM